MRYLATFATIMLFGVPGPASAQEFQCQVKGAVTEIRLHHLALDSIAGVAMFPDTSGRLWSVQLQFRNGKSIEANPKANKIIFREFSRVDYKAILPGAYRPGDLILKKGRVIYPVSLGIRNIETWECPEDGD